MRDRILSGERHIQVEENAIPVVHPPRRVPYALMDKLKTELDRMKQLDIIEEIDEPTERVSSLVIVEKADGRLRICLDHSGRMEDFVCLDHSDLDKVTLSYAHSRNSYVRNVGREVFLKIRVGSGPTSKAWRHLGTSCIC